MLTCINKNSTEYRTLKDRSGISDSILEAICRDFLDKYDRFPYLDEIIGSNSDPYLRNVLQLDMYNGTSIQNLLSVTGTDTVEDANIVLNDQYRDVEVEITTLNKEAIVEITKRPTEDNFDNWTEEDEILAKAPRDEQGNLLAPNGRISNLTEKQYAQVRTKAFKRWFGDWEKANTFNINAIDTSKVDIEEHNKPWKNDPTKSNKTLRIYIKGQREKGYFELVKDQEFGIFSVHFKTGNANTGEIYGSTKEERSILYKQLLNALPNGAQLSTWGELSEGGIKALNKLGKNLKKVGERQVKDRQGNNISIPIYQKGEGVSKVVDENGEPLVVYHGSKNSWEVYDKSRFKRDQFGRGIYLTEDKSNAENYGNTREFFVNSKNPFYAGYIWENGRKSFRPKAAGLLFNSTIDKESYVEMLQQYTNEKEAEFIGNQLKNADSVVITYRNPYIVKYGEIIVSNPNQIKSASSNSGLFSRTNDNIYDPAPNGYLVMTNALNKLASLYGIKFNDITDAELASDKWRNIISDPSSVNAFVYNGQIYINIDRANLDAPIHEMMHLFVGSIRFQNPNLYQHLISLSEQFPNYNKLAREFSGRTRNDINEEIFVQEVSRYLVGLPSNISNIESKLQYEITYNIKRVLDTILMGEDSVKTLSNDRLFNLSLKEIAREIHSSVMTNNFHGTLNVENSELHRKLNNIKSDLQSKGILKEYCD